MNVAQLLENTALSYPKRPAVSVGCHAVFDYSQLGERTARLASAIRNHAGDSMTVAITTPNCPEYLEILYATWHAGLAAAPMNAKLSARELAFMVRDCGARLVFTSAEQAAELQALLDDVAILVPRSADYHVALQSPTAAIADRQTSDLAWIFYTSGTTGKPKGAMLSHGNLMAMTLAYYADIDSLGEHDALLHLAATSHASGLFGLSFVARAGNNVLPESGGFEAAELATLINHYPKLSFFMPPTLLRRLDRYQALVHANLDNVKAVLLGAAPITPADLRTGYAMFGAKLWNGYGQGESPCTITAMSKTMIAQCIREQREDRLASVGIVRTGLRIAVLNDEGQPLAPGATGEIAVSGATVMQGYLNRPDATAETVVAGWLRTGDIGRLDDEGYLTLLDRKKDVIISGGMNIYAREVEDVLHESSDIADIAVIGLPDAEWGESVLAIVVASPGSVPDLAALDDLCLARLARFKRPKYYYLVGDLPRNASGKVLKRQLRDEMTLIDPGAFLKPR